MQRTFIQTSEFERNWETLGFSDDNLQKLEQEILKHPKTGKVIRGTGKLRKMRFAFDNKGKSGSVRVCYVDFEEKGTIYLITAYRKNAKDNLTKTECNNIKKLIGKLEESLLKGGKV